MSLFEPSARYGYFSSSSSHSTRFVNEIRRFDSVYFSWKVFFHILLLIGATAQLMIDSTEAEYMRSARRSWLHFFFPSDYTLGPEEAPINPHYLYTSNEVINALRNALRSYETIVDTSLDSLAYSPPGEGSPTEPPPAILTIKKYSSPNVFDPNKNYDGRTETETFAVNSTNLAILEPEESRLEILRRVVHLELAFQLVTIELVTFRRSCLVWNILLFFEFAARGQMNLRLHDIIKRDCDDTTSSSDLLQFNDFLWLNVVLLIICFGYFLSLLKQHIFYEEKHSNSVLDPVRSSTKIKQMLLNFWFISETLCLICVVMSSALNISTNSARRPSSNFHAFLVGLGNCLIWINAVQYFSNNKTYFALILTLERSVPKVMKFLLGVAPIFMGYAVFGVAFFGSKTVRFSGIRNAFVALFSLLNGDAVNETFQDLLPHHSFITMFYVYSFILLWTYVVLNILIAIVEESFFISLWVDNKKRQSSEEDELSLLKY